jgi:hypothetical protein
MPILKRAAMILGAAFAAATLASAARRMRAQRSSELPKPVLED